MLGKTLMYEIIDEQEHKDGLLYISGHDKDYNNLNSDLYDWDTINQIFSIVSDGIIKAGFMRMRVNHSRKLDIVQVYLWKMVDADSPLLIKGFPREI